MTSLARPRMQI